MRSGSTTSSSPAAARSLGLVAALLAPGCGAPGATAGGGSTGPDVAPTPTAAAVTIAPGSGGNNLLRNSDFEEGVSLPWTTSFSDPATGKAAVTKGALCLNVDRKGTNPWDAQVRHREMVMKKGHTYTIEFVAYASKPTKVRPKVGMSGPPYAEYWASTIELDDKPRRFVGSFKMGGSDDPTAEFAFHMGGNLAAADGYRVCIDDVRLADPEFTPPPIEKVAPVPRVRVNQLGYAPTGPKGATVKNKSQTPLRWELIKDKAVVASGQTTVYGEDPAAGEHTHVVDFSSYQQPGTGLTLRVDGEESYPFDIRPDLYAKLKYDALAYYYLNRSGTALTMPFTGGEAWARPAGHTSDRSVACQPGSGCSYSLDVSGGWYDAGDFGKYVVNGGIAVWTLLDLYERMQRSGGAAELGDGKLSIPENKNGVADLLDEARWELEFLLKMQVPANQPLAGMVHHKVHDEKWTSLGLAPHESTMKRWLHAPSTAATLNLAAVAAQAARIWKGIDASFADRCLSAAERAWAAAQANPNRIAPGADKEGGGPYDDPDVSDEFYWAAVELFVTTGKDVYKTSLLKSPHHLKVPSPAGGATVQSSMDWAKTGALGVITLAVVPSGIDGAPARAAITAAADAYLEASTSSSYRSPLRANKSNQYPWGSNSFVLNNGVILALAHDFTKQPKYLEGAIRAMDYLLGRNPLAQSYVTGYGENPLKHPHHRVWSQQIDPKRPPPPPGAVSGGPNSGIEDPHAQAAGLGGCQPMRCFVDHIESWSTNEVCINWNAPFAWLAAVLDEKLDPGHARSPAKPKKP